MSRRGGRYAVVLQSDRAHGPLHRCRRSDVRERPSRRGFGRRSPCADEERALLLDQIRDRRSHPSRPSPVGHLCGPRAARTSRRRSSCSSVCSKPARRAARTTAAAPRGRGSPRRRSSRPRPSPRRTPRAPRARSPASRRTSGASIAEARSFSGGVQYASMSSIGGGSRPRVPRRMFVNDCCGEVNSRRAVVVVVGDDHVRADHRVRLARSCSDGRNVER